VQLQKPQVFGRLPEDADRLDHPGHAGVDRRLQDHLLDLRDGRFAAAVEV
jgi:hypothetical protein